MDFDNNTLVEITMICKNKTICKNMGGLKYIEIYCFETFKKLYKELLNKECPEPDYIKQIKLNNVERRRLRDIELGNGPEDNDLIQDDDEDEYENSSSSSSSSNDNVVEEKS